MWKLLGTPKIVKMTPAIAKEFKAMEPAPGDRDLADNRAEKLKAMVVAKNFRPCVWAKAYCKETGKTYRVNGKHTSNVMSELNGETKGLFAMIELYECDTLDDLAKLYATFDSRVSVRSTGDINRSFSHAIAELEGVTSATINTAISGLALAIWGDKYSRVTSPEQRAELLRANTDFVLWIDSLFHGVGNKDRNAIRRAPVVAAMYLTRQKDKKAAEEFWLAVRDGSGQKHTSGDRRLNKYLLTTAVASGSGRGTKKTGDKARSSNTSGLATGYEMFAKCIHGWNAWRRGAVTDLKYYANAEFPKVI